MAVEEHGQRTVALRPTDADREWARQQIAEHGPPPQRIIDLLRRLAERHSEEP